MTLPEFFALAGSRFEVRLQDACRLAGINYQTACNQRHRGVFPLPVTKRSRNNVVVKIDDLYAYVYGVKAVTAPVSVAPPAVGRRGKPRKEEVAEARSRGLSVPQLRRLKAGLEG
ncbi:hypothetical protein [Dechloromonas agitata]|uniref:hypothetical protein n=1 Tax=Dechloromonas agitata TaxID=73030 RepID=UPI00048058E4|nr:hypothetical protein [Dechloromonas agitata]